MSSGPYRVPGALQSQLSVAEIVVSCDAIAPLCIWIDSQAVERRGVSAKLMLCWMSAPLWVPPC